MGISPALDTTISDGDSGHESDHERIAAFLNGLFDISTSTPQAVAATGTPGTTGNVSDAGHRHSGVVLAGAGVVPKAANKVPNAGANGAASDAAHIHPTRLWQPGDNGLLTATDDPARVNSQNVLGFGNVLLLRMRAGDGVTLTNIDYGITVVGSSLTTNQCFVGVYSLAGVRLGKSADQAANFMSSASINGRKAPLTADAAGSLVIAPGDEFWGAVLVNGTGTGPTWWRVGSQNFAANYGLTGAALRFASLTGPFTDLPASFTPSSLSTTTAYWLGAS